jgi:hypothetical protein
MLSSLAPAIVGRNTCFMVWIWASTRKMFKSSCRRHDCFNVTGSQLVLFFVVHRLVTRFFSSASPFYSTIHNREYIYILLTRFLSIYMKYRIGKRQECPWFMWLSNSLIVNPNGQNRLLMQQPANKSAPGAMCYRTWIVFSWFAYTSADLQMSYTYWHTWAVKSLIVRKNCRHRMQQDSV